VGISRKSAPLRIRERAALDERATRRLLRGLAKTNAIGGAFALPTCDRTEVYAVEHAPARSDTTAVIREALCSETSISPEELVRFGYVYEDEDAAEHFFGVVAGLDSTVLGESEIVGQVRRAVAVAKEEGLMDGLLGGMFSHAMSAARQVRARTSISRGSLSVPTIAIDLAARLLGSLANRRAVVIGAGKVACAVTRGLSARGPRGLVVANRSLAPAMAIAREARGRAVPLTALNQELRLADLVVSATAAPSPIVSRSMLTTATDGRQDPLIVIDLALPRDVEPDADDLGALILRDLDAVQRIADENLAHRRRELPRAWSIIRSQAERFQAWCSAREAEPTLRAIRAQADAIRRLEIQRATADLPALDERELERLDFVTRSVVNKLLHEPTSRIRAAGTSSDGVAKLAALAELFGVTEAARGEAVSAEPLGTVLRPRWPTAYEARTRGVALPRASPRLPAA
jgi:glutamyl-tRNA reductase